MKSSEFITEVDRRTALKGILGGVGLKYAMDPVAKAVGSITSALTPANRRPDNQPDKIPSTPKPTTPQSSTTTKPSTTKIEPAPQPELFTPQTVKPQIPSRSSPKQREYRLMTAAEDSGIRGLELAQFMAQCAVESHDFRALETYSTEDKLKSYAALKNVGNETRDDNWRYRARGYIHLFGRDNYRIIGRKLGIDLESNPDLAAREDIAERIAIEFWLERVRPYMQRNASLLIDRSTGKPASKQSRPENLERRIDWTNTRAATYPVNKNYEHLDRRAAAFRNWRERIADYERGSRTLEEARKRKSKKSKSKRSSRSRSKRVSGVFFPGYWGWGGSWESGNGGADGGGE